MPGTPSDPARPADVHVLTEVVVFGPTTRHHVVTLLDGERETLRLFVRKDHRGLGRFHDEENMRLFSHQRKDDFDRYTQDEAPIVEHASLAEFFAHVGYSFRRNAFAIPAQAAA